MIQANELRIGNWITYKYEPIQVTMIGQYGIQSKDKDSVTNAKFVTPDLKPIPLTAEILEQCGFKNTILGGEYVYNERGIMKIYINSIGLVSYKIGDIIFTTIHYLHQLQNLYFALTGEELQVNLNAQQPSVI